MDLKGAEIRDIYNLCKGMNFNTNVSLCIKIPFYQRPYRWENEQIKNLINDFQNNKKDNLDDEYFLGSIVLVENESEKDVIDGQQRITTVFLLGYLYFLIQRARIQELIERKGSNLTDKLKDLKDIYSSIIGSTHIKEFENMVEKITGYMDDENDDKESKYDKIEKIYCQCVGLPLEKNLSNIDRYLDIYEHEQDNFLCKEKLGLSYSRDSYNSYLKEALKKICITVSKDNGIEINIKNKKPTEDIEQFLDVNSNLNPNTVQYIKAIWYEYKNIIGLADKNNDNLKYTENILKYIKEMLDNLKFCVIITGNEKDAYTLFEVLNDRALAIDDLELIKNMFFKTYCLTSGDGDVVIDKNIGDMDNLWGDDIFNRNLLETIRKNISLWGTVYLTGDTDITAKQVAKYREPLDTKYLSLYNKKDNLYTFLLAWNDIMIFNMVSVLIKKFNIKVRNTAEYCIEAEKDVNKSTVYKTMHFLNALGQTGVMSAIINYIVRYYIDKVKRKDESKIDIDNFGKYVADLIEASKQSNYIEINVLAHKLWQVSMLSNTYKNTRKYSCDVIKNVNRLWCNIDVKQLISNMDMKALHKEFNDWSSEQCYNKKEKTLKLKILFIRLIRTKKNNDVLIYTPGQYTFTTATLQLDHLEAKNIDSANKKAYFEPKNSGESRETYIHGLGNLMLLDSKHNTDKNNKPLHLAIQYYSNLCSGPCWLVDEIKQMLSKDQYSTLIEGSNQRKPKEEFFIERGKRLRKYFYKIIEADLNQTEISLK